MSQSAWNREGGRAPAGLIGAIGLMIAVELFVARHDLLFSDFAVEGFRFAGRSCGEARDCDVLCLGDSLVKCGVAPRVIEARTGRRALNLAIAGGTPPVTYFLLRRALEAGARPSVILVDFKANNLQVDPRVGARCLSAVLDARDCLDLAWTSRDAPVFASLMLARLLPSVGARFAIRENVRVALDGGETAARRHIPPHRRNWRVNRGVQLVSKNPIAAAMDTYWDEGACLVEGWRGHPISVVYLSRFLALAASHRIPVVWLVPPLNPKVQAKRDLRGLDAPYDRFLRTAMALFPDLTIVDGRRAGYPASLFVDANHLDGQGAYAFTDDVAALLRGRLAPGGDRGRLVAIPRYRERPIDLPLEDLGQSAVAIQSLEAARRR